MKTNIQNTSPINEVKCLLSLGICGLVMFAGGCAISQEGFLQDYATVGGKWQRTDPTYGRVGSVFSDPNYTGAVISHDDSVIIEEGDAYYGNSMDEMGAGDYYTPEEYVPGPTQVDQDGVIILGDDW